MGSNGRGRDSSQRHDVTWHKVAGHSGHPLNDRADALARAAIPKR